MMGLSIHYSQIPNHKGKHEYPHSTSWCTHSNIYLENQQHPTHCDSNNSITRERLNSYHMEDLKQAQYNLVVSLIPTNGILQSIWFHPLKIENFTILIMALKYNFINFYSLKQISLENYVHSNLPMDNKTPHTQDGHKFINQANIQTYMWYRYHQLHKPHSNINNKLGYPDMGLRFISVSKRCLDFVLDNYNIKVIYPSHIGNHYTII